MTMPNVTAPSFKPVIEELFALLSRSQEEQCIRAHLHYEEVEEAAVHEAVRLAAQHPDSARRVWETMEASFDDANAELLEVDAPALNWVGYSTFLAELVADYAARKSAA